jgi:hypothetical protein
MDRKAVSATATSRPYAFPRLPLRLHANISRSARSACCSENSPLDRPASSEELQAADELVREYLTAAAADDGRRLCSLRAARDVRRLGGRAQCEHRLARSAADAGEACLEDGHATGGTVVMARVYEKDGQTTHWDGRRGGLPRLSA